jgi:hypothetical protein
MGGEVARLRAYSLSDVLWLKNFNGLNRKRIGPVFFVKNVCGVQAVDRPVFFA